jgi:hypothetical protein
MKKFSFVVHLVFLFYFILNDYGEIDFKNSCDIRSKNMINEAISILHSFWFFESYKRFERISSR